MKYLFLLLTVVYTSQSLAQDPDPDLFQTWYLYAFDPDNIPILISEIDPPIFPVLTISENLEFNGTGACNSFSGLYTVPYEGALEVNEYAETLDDCGFQNHNSFEGQYFGFMSVGFDYEISEEQGGLLLRLRTPLMYWAEYRNYPLSTPDIALAGLTLYPNPSSSQVFVNAGNTTITNIEIHNLLGKRFNIGKNNFEAIDISFLESGMYLVKLNTEYGATVRKLVKE